jgi:transmembrane sensor
VAIGTVATFVVAVIATLLYLHTDAVETGVGELRTLTLNDGTRVHLNTNTRLEVRYDKKLRKVSLERGEALFEVAKNPTWPFVVSARNREIRALGTAFDVRSEERKLAVMLVEGSVAVASSAGTGQEALFARIQVPSPQAIVLSPGERLTLASGSAPRIDRPAIDGLTAWERGQVELDDASLSDAVEEMNRYSNIRIVIDARNASSIRVSGIFRAGDSANFARAVARTYHLAVAGGDRAIVLVDGSP